MIYEVEFLDSFLGGFFSITTVYSAICDLPRSALEIWIFIWNIKGAQSNFQRIQKEFRPIVHFDPSFTRVS